MPSRMPLQYRKRSSLVLIMLLIPIVGLAGGVSIVVYVLRNSENARATPFLMMLAGALVFGFLPAVLLNFWYPLASKFRAFDE